MAELKNTIVNGFLKVNGVIESDVSKFNFEDDMYEIEFARLIDPSVLNDEVELFTVPAGYKGMINGTSSYSNVSISYSSQVDTPVLAWVLTLYAFIEQTADEQSWVTSSNAAYYATFIGTNPYIDEGAMRAKITTAGTGFTGKILINGKVIILKKIGY